MKKICQKCQVEKSTEEFYTDNSKPDGKLIYCKTCCKKTHKKTYASNAELQKIKAKQYREFHKNDHDYIQRKKEYNEKYRLKYWKKEGAWRPENRELRLQKRRQYRNTRHQQFPEIYLVEASKERARKKGLEHTLTTEDIQIPSHCPVLGIPIVVGVGKQTDNSPSIDRIDNERGYVKENVIVVSWKANDLKGRATVEELEKIVSFYKKL